MRMPPFSGAGRENTVTEKVIMSKLPKGPAERELLAAVEQKMRDQPSLQYHEALKLVASECPDLSERYTRETRGY